MSVFIVILLGVVAIIVVYGVLIYNNLVNLKHNVGKAWANIDVLLKQRHDEIPKLVETCKQYMKFEQETLQKVMEARAKVSDARESRDVQALGQAEGQLRLGLGNLFAVAEAYPELKTSETFLQLSRASAASKTRSPTGASSTTRASTSTMSASSSFPTTSSPALFCSSLSACSNSKPRKIRSEREAALRLN